jgi:hypothetical protein
MYVRLLVRASGILAAACACAAVLGVGVPLGWVWVASQLQTSTGQAISGVAALVVIVGPLATYFSMLTLAERIRRRAGGEVQPQRMAWNRSRDEVRESARQMSALDQVVVIATLLVGAGFEVWFFLFAHQQPWGS